MGRARGKARHPTIRDALLLGLGSRLDRRAALCEACEPSVDANRGSRSRQATVTDRRAEFPDALGQAMSRLKEVAAERQRARPGSRKHKELLEHEARLISRVTTLGRLREAADRGPRSRSQNE